jgi:hypothetical protein
VAIWKSKNKGKKISKIWDEKCGLIFIVLVNYRFLSSLWLLFLMRMIKKLSPIEIFLPWTNKTLKFWFIILPWKIYIYKFSLLQIRLTNFALCISATIPSPFIFLMLFRNRMSFIVLLMGYSFIGAIYIYLFKLTNLFIDIANLQNACTMFQSLSLRAKTLLFMIDYLSITDLVFSS